MSTTARSSLSTSCCSRCSRPRPAHAESDRVALRPRPACVQAVLRPVRGHPVVHQERRLHLQPGRRARAPEVPQEETLQGSQAGAVVRQPLGKNPSTYGRSRMSRPTTSRRPSHPCQFPVELIERLVLSMTDPGDWVLDPFMGVGTTAIAAAHARPEGALAPRSSPKYVEIAKERIRLAEQARCVFDRWSRPVYDPDAPGRVPPRGSCDWAMALSSSRPSSIERSDYVTAGESAMKVVYEYSHLGGAEILKVRYPRRTADLRGHRRQSSQDARSAKRRRCEGRALYAPTDMNAQFQEAFNRRGYRGASGHVHHHTFRTALFRSRVHSSKSTS